MKIQSSLIALLVVLASCSISQKRTVEILQEAEAGTPYEAIIVPGVPHDGQHWQRTMLMRVRWSEYIYHKGLAENIIYSGGAVYTKYSEAKIMASYASAIGLPAAGVFLDTNAEHSTENVYYSYRIAKAQGFTKIALATDPFQGKSMRKFIKKHELPIDILPIVFDTLSTLDHSEPKIDPQQSIQANFVSLKERQGFFRRLGGTFGKEITWYKSDLSNRHLMKKYARQGRLIDDVAPTTDQ
ncbi:MAG: hypothetical protein A3D92_21710 [Bacteroidetes bacterium RIFCSPHIGHO2_02_FULL_44_7]|nr:MAG: hypothetical protein A3D92_21710 [Bacteroidetes bacterium RIFCSPHIGHO2_02_FULL_44_7]